MSMSSYDEQSDEEHLYHSGHRAWNGDEGTEEPAKKRRRRACDACRRRKIKCDGTEISTCKNCIASRTLCTYSENISKRRAPIHPDYVEALKNRIRKLERLLTELFPNADLRDEDLTADDLRHSLLHTEASLSAASTLPNKTTSRMPEELEEAKSDNGNDTSAESEHTLWSNARRFHGKSSGVMFLTDALNIKRESSDPPTPADSRYIEDPARLTALADYYYSETANPVLTNEPPPRFTFPPKELMASLISLFFYHVNPLLPVLHRPIFKSLYHAQLHIQDPEFASVLLLVCAVGSRYSDDIRVLPAEQQALSEKDTRKWHFAGIEYFAQVYRHLGRPLTRAPALSDLQKFALACLYLTGSKTAPYAWSLSGFGIRLALEAGANRKKKGDGMTVERQLWSRAFWALVALDRLGSASTGRPWAVQDEDIDVDLPIAVDDEYWDPPDPSDAWKQPSSKPAVAEHFRALVKLLEILVFALRTLYSSNKSKLILGLAGPSWEQRVVAEIDSALNKWVDSMPDHLRWNPHQENSIFFNQSAFLNCLYYQVQTFVHRPFITQKTSSPLSFPSLAICTNAARSSSHILEIQSQRDGTLAPMINCAFTSGIVLLLNIWGVKKLGVRADSGRHMQDIFKCMDWLKTHSKRWAKAQVGRNILSILLSAGAFPHPQPNPVSNSLVGMKRPHDSNGQDENRGGTSGPSPVTSSAHAPNRVDQAVASADAFFDEIFQFVPGRTPSTGTSTARLEQPFTSADLGVLPLYPELYAAGDAGIMQPSSVTSEPRYSSTDEVDVQNISGGASYAWSGAGQPTPAAGAGTFASASTYHGPGQQWEDGLYSVGQVLNTEHETSLGHDTLSMWATAPTSFEAQEWGEFAQGFLLEEQYATHTLSSSDAGQSS